MNPVLERIRANPLFRAAIAAPIAIMIVFSLFNLTSATDQTKVPAAVTLGIVNLDEGSPNGPPLAAQILAGMTSGLPMGTTMFATEAEARAALDDGDVSAVLLFPADFTAAVAGGGAVNVRLIATHHLSLAETQLSRSIAGQIEAGLSAAVTAIRTAMANGAFPPAEGAPLAIAPAATVSTELLYEAKRPESFSAPFVMTYATWLASFVSGLMAFLATRGLKGRESLIPVAAVRSLLPILVPAAAGLVLAIIVAWTTDNWGGFFGLWLFAWLATTAISLMMAGLFASFGLFAIIIALPAAFYQSALSGTQAPIGAIPDWLRPIADALPFSDIGTGYRTLVIGGPEGSVPILMLLVVAVAGLALIWLGTWLYHGALGGRPAPVSG